MNSPLEINDIAYIFDNKNGTWTVGELYWMTSRKGPDVRVKNTYVMEAQAKLIVEMLEKVTPEQNSNNAKLQRYINNNEEAEAERIRMMRATQLRQN